MVSLPESTGWAWLLQVKDFLGTEEKQKCGKVELTLRFLLRKLFDEVKGKKGLGCEGVRNDVGFTKEEGMVFKAWLVYAAIVGDHY